MERFSVFGVLAEESPSGGAWPSAPRQIGQKMAALLILFIASIWAGAQMGLEIAQILE
jgi:hypothetical protein